MTGPRGIGSMRTQPDPLRQIGGGLRENPPPTTVQKIGGARKRLRKGRGTTAAHGRPHANRQFPFDELRRLTCCDRARQTRAKFLASRPQPAAQVGLDWRCGASDLSRDTGSASGASAEAEVSFAGGGRQRSFDTEGACGDSMRPSADRRSNSPPLAADHARNRSAGRPHQD
jgi:hypothetical protein